jgi:hypothetical protein
MLTHILSSIKAPPNHALFLPRVFALISRTLQQERLKQKIPPIELIFLDEFEELSRRLDRSQIQESTSVRNLIRTRALANLLINDKGDVNEDLLPAAIETLQAHLYSLGPGRQYDAKRQLHILNVLKTLRSNKEMIWQLKKNGRPVSNKYAEALIRDTLQLSSQTPLTDAHARRAVLSAWLCYLRQNIGSCFATAPAEVVHDEQPALFLQDMTDLLATGQLKRVVRGIEYAVPISASWGNADLKKPLVIQHSLKGFSPEIWYSPGLIAAFEACGILRIEESTKHKTAQVKHWVEALFQSKGSLQPYFIITGEEIIRAILLQVLGLTEQQIIDYENRPRPMIQSQLLMQAPTKGSNSIGERCAHFIYQFEMAKNAFKSLTDNALLKAWEFTLASFSETKQEFTRWNLYASLGMGTEEVNGIGHCIYQIIQHKLDAVNRKVQDIQYEYEMVYSQVKAMEARMRGASEQELQWLKLEYRSLTNEFYSLEEIRDDIQLQAKNLVTLYESLHSLYTELFKDFFQEVYDPDMQEVIIGPFDDSPAGFQLLYKHGRSNTSQWTRIKNHVEFIEALTSFFAATEPRIADLFEEKGLQKDVADVVTGIINHVRTKEFLESAFYRMAVAHNTAPIRDPLQNLDKIEKKPWAYTSGGTMNTLVSCYYRLEDKPKEEAKWVESEIELLVFLADTLKRIPAPLIKPYLTGEHTSMLMQSPTHAFILKPMQHPFRDVWNNEEFTYTFVRDHIVRPAQSFIEGLLLDDEMLRFLIDQLLEKVPENFQPRFKSVFQSISGPLNVILFRDYLVDTMVQDRGLNYRGRPVLAQDEIDSYLFSHLPLFPLHELKQRVHHILLGLPGIDALQAQSMLDLFDQFSLSRLHLIVSAHQLEDICKALLCLAAFQTSTSLDYPLLIHQTAQKLGYAMPAPLIFADTNWVKDEFGFVVNPGTGKVELWRLDYLGSAGYPMTDWKQWVNGSRPDQKWGLYIRPYEYGQV